MELLHRVFVKTALLTNRIDYNTFAIIAVTVVLVGCLCMRGNGSRHSF